MIQRGQLGIVGVRKVSWIATEASVDGGYRECGFPIGGSVGVRMRMEQRIVRVFWKRLHGKFATWHEALREGLACLASALIRVRVDGDAGCVRTAAG
jgi:hypothetical protein